MKDISTAQLCVIITSRFASRPPVEVARRAVDGGADVIQLREKEMSDRQFKDLAVRMRNAVDPERALLIVNDRVAIARLIGAAGAHVGQDDLPAVATRKLLGEEAILGVSTHSLEQAHSAVADGADYIGIGPMFPTATKGYASGVGVDYLRRASEEIDIPLFAIGGINLDNIDRVISACRSPAARRVAVCSAIISQDDITGVTRKFKEKLSAV